MHHRLRVSARGGERFVVRARVANLIFGLFALAAIRISHRRLAGDHVERLLNLHRIARERHAHFHAAVVRRDHRFVAGAHHFFDEVFHLLEDAIAIERRHRQVIDVEDDAALLIFRNVFDADRLRGLGSGRRRGLGHLHGHAVRRFDFVEIRDRLEHAVLVDFEIFFLEAGDRHAFFVGDDDIHIDDADVDRFGELRDFTRRLRRGILRLLLRGCGERGDDGRGDNESFQGRGSSGVF